jgi:hypothetical protein
MQDDLNRSVKEKERMKKELEIKRRFLGIHLNQTIDLLKLRTGLLKDKIQQLQTATLELIQQKISILEKQLSDSIKTHISNLQEERRLIVENQFELRKEMAVLPQKWASEMIIEHQLKMNAAMVEEVTKLVESKNIATNLEMIQSAPVDLAVPPARPVRPKLILFSLLGAVLGALLISFYIGIKDLIRGLPASREGLELAGLHVSGEISKSPVKNIAALKRLAGFLSRSKDSAEGSSFLLCKGNGCCLGEEVKNILEKSGSKVLIIDCTEKADAGKGKGQIPLALCLEDWDILNDDRLEKLSVSENGAFELLISKKFRMLLEELKKRYEWVIAVVNATPISGEAESLISIFDWAAFYISGETQHELYHLIQTLKKEGKENFTTFLLTEEN